jgi:hypothetical protein
MEDKAYYCNCNGRLHLQDANTREWMCRHCGISYYPEQQDVKGASQFEPPGGEVEEPSISYSPNPNDSFFDKYKVEPKGTFKDLQKRGTKLISYNEYDGSGREIKYE